MKRKVVANIDLAPTIYAAARIQPDYLVDGQDLFSSHRTEIYAEMFPAAADNIWAWKQPWTPRIQYIRYPRHNEHEAYEADPYQLTNLFNDGAPTLSPIHATMMLCLIATQSVREPLALDLAEGRDGREATHRRAASDRTRLRGESVGAPMMTAGVPRVCRGERGGPGD